MNISIFWTWYVWLVSWVCFAEIWHNVLCYDLDIEKINKFILWECIIYENWLEKLFKKNIKNWRLKFTSDFKRAIIHWKVVFSCVWTPVDKKDWLKTDLSQVFDVATNFWKHLDSYKIFVNKSTVPVWTWKLCNNIIQQEIKKRWININYDIVSNPEFLREWTAIFDFLNPDRIVYWTSSKKSLNIMREIYSNFIIDWIKIIETDIQTSELIKYASNSYLAMKLSFINEIANFSEILWLNIDDVIKWVWADKRIWNNYLKPGIWYGWSCFSKDIKSFISIWNDFWFDFQILKDVENINEKQKIIIINKLVKYYKNLDEKIISIWWISYKEWTDDIRDAPSIEIIKNLLKLWIKEIKIYDIIAYKNIKKIFELNKNIFYFEDKYEALNKSDCLMLLTWWEEFINIDFDIIKSKMKTRLILDWRNFFNKEQFLENWFIYEWIWK